MTADVLREAIRINPFQPFRLIQSDGKTFDIRHPDGIMLGMTYAVIGIYGQEQAYPERYTTLDLKHVIRMEPIAAPAPNENPF